MPEIPGETAGRHFNRRLVLAVALASFGSMTYGYSAGVTGTTLGQPSFTVYMGLDTAPNANALIGAMNALFYTGGFFGILLNSWLADKVGRKKSLAAGASLALVAAALLAGSVHIGMFIAFRFVSGFGAYILVMTVPLWITETAPPQHRGAFGLAHGFMINVGYLVSSYCGFGFFVHLRGVNVWRGPIAVGVAPPLILLLGLRWLPETPRYLIMQGRHQAASQVVENLHISHGSKDREYAQREIIQMQTQVDFDKSLDARWSVLFRRNSYLKRALMSVLMIVTVISSGGQVIASYGTILYLNLGFDTKQILLLFSGLYCCSTFGHPVAMLYIDRVPRNILLAFSLLVLMAFTTVYTGLTAVYLEGSNKAAQAAAVAMTYLYFFFYGASVDAPSFIYCSELFPMHIRGKGMTFGMATYSLISLVWVMAGPTALANIKWGFFVIMILITFVGALIIWGFFPDTKGRTLEEIATLFGDDDLVAIYQRDITLNERLEMEGVKEGAGVLNIETTIESKPPV